MEHSPEVMRHCVDTYLADIRGKRDDMRDLEWRMDELRCRLDNLSAPSGGAGGAGGADPMASGLAALEDLQAQWSDAAETYAADIAAAVAICPPSSPERHAVWLHSVERMTWGAVARRLGYSEAHVKKDMAPRGIAGIYADMPEEYRRYSIPNAAPF